MKIFGRTFAELPEISRLLLWDLEGAADVNGNLACDRKRFSQVAKSLNPRRRSQLERAAYYLHASGYLRFYRRGAHHEKTFIHLPRHEPDPGRFPFRAAPPYNELRDPPEYLPWSIESISRHHRRGRRLAGKPRGIPFDTVPDAVPAPEDVMCFRKPPGGVLYPMRVDLRAGRVELLRPTTAYQGGPFVRGAWIFARRAYSAVIFQAQPAGYVKIGHGTGTPAAAAREALRPLHQGKRDIEIICLNSQLSPLSPGSASALSPY